MYFMNAWLQQQQTVKPLTVEFKILEKKYYRISEYNYIVQY